MKFVVLLTRSTSTVPQREAVLQGTRPCKSSGLALDCFYCVGTTLTRPLGNAGYISAQLSNDLKFVSLCLVNHELFNLSVEQNNLIG